MSETLDAVMDSVDKHWAAYDEDESGELSRAEFRDFVNDVLDAHDLAPDERGFRRVFRDYDEDGSGTINREECDEMLKHMWISASVNLAWEEFDKDEDEGLSRREFRQFARVCLDAMGYDPDWRNGELNDLMEDYDEDGDGFMSADECFTFIDEFVGSSLEADEE